MQEELGRLQFQLAVVLGVAEPAELQQLSLSVVRELS